MEKGMSIREKREYWKKEIERLQDEIAHASLGGNNQRASELINEYQAAVANYHRYDELIPHDIRIP